ncbi:uncharacterized protein LACBIDRAFT_316558 [Laccaria bicolor S238N-H82]|uniref:Predicted protein n=1 Tax=Laccaria bicolor (strain S238N-H82 / ATCC MYA-4686) TaxID=486041 RepID=B0E152_LACBS|nr:uncharacterized protein LACBIDRAFT_316558 [Laccaria bicolor S238N-H82]EDQ99394.1 predicted protein [Laccaria bicolor S238N-H82]|eukprot:XP_001889945.1 predicted protein [Laccaria bicolor S238N-H82]
MKAEIVTCFCQLTHSLIDPNRVVIRGQSAGGYTVLAALSISSDTRAFAAATSSYGISNFKMLAEFTHEFESKYLDELIGGSYDEAPEVYGERSPINHADIRYCFFRQRSNPKLFMRASSVTWCGGIQIV